MRVIFKKSFDKHYAKLGKRIQTHFEERLRLFLENPFHPLLNNHDVDEAFPDCRSINVTGDYRALYKEKENIPVFVKIGTHHELYGK